MEQGIGRNENQLGHEYKNKRVACGEKSAARKTHEKVQNRRQSDAAAEFDHVANF